MDPVWWQLPGPSRFVQGVLQELRSGKNVVLVLPAHAPGHLRDALCQRVRENDLWQWRALDAAELPAAKSVELIEALHGRFGPCADAAELRTAATLAKQLRGRIVWVENIDGPRWAGWSRFLGQYQHACQARGESERGLFCVSAAGDVQPSPVADAALSVRRLHGVVGRLDVSLYLDRALSGRFRYPLHHQVALAVAVELAGSDARLAHRLAGEDLGALMTPFALLSEYAAERGWNAERACRPTWQDGMCDDVEGVRFVHSAAVAAQGNRAEVARRVWRGQVAVLFPFIEEQRVRLLPQLRGHIRLPVETTYGLVADAEDLEVGQLLHFLRNKRVAPRLWRHLSLLTEMRHSLAHLEPVPASVLFADDLLRAEE